VIKTLEQFDWSWPKKINRPHVQNLFRLSLTSAVLDRLLHHAETVTIEGKSYRMKDQIQEP